MKNKKKPFQGYNRKQLKIECSSLREMNNTFWNTIISLRTRKEDLESEVEIQQNLIEKLKEVNEKHNIKNCDLVEAHASAFSDWEQEKADIIQSNKKLLEVCQEMNEEIAKLENEIMQLQNASLFERVFKKW